MTIEKKIEHTYIITCDRCGSESKGISPSEAHARAAALEGFGRLKWSVHHDRLSDSDSWSLCGTCSSELDQWLHGLLDGQTFLERVTAVDEKGQPVDSGAGPSGPE